MACAVTWFKDRGCSGVDSMLPNTGMSPRDLVSDTIMKLVVDGKWREVSDRRNLYLYARKLMWNDFLDLVKSSEYKKTVITDSIDAEQGEPLLTNLSGADEVIEAGDVAALEKSLQPLLGRDRMVKAYLSLLLRKPAAKREDIAYLLGLTDRQVTDTRRRLFYKIKPFLSAKMFAGDRTEV